MSGRPNNEIMTPDENAEAASILQIRICMMGAAFTDSRKNEWKAMLCKLFRAKVV